MRKKWLELMGVIALALLGAACAETGVGDSCVPENVSPGGSLATETYLETSSLQCATRVCLVRGLDGDPNNLQEDDCPLGDATCVPLFREDFLLAVPKGHRLAGRQHVREVDLEDEELLLLEDGH